MPRLAHAALPANQTREIYTVPAGKSAALNVLFANPSRAFRLRLGVQQAALPAADYTAWTNTGLGALSAMNQFVPRNRYDQAIGYPMAPGDWIGAVLRASDNRWLLSVDGVNWQGSAFSGSDLIDFGPRPQVPDGFGTGSAVQRANGTIVANQSVAGGAVALRIYDNPTDMVPALSTANFWTPGGTATPTAIVHSDAPAGTGTASGNNGLYLFYKGNAAGTNGGGVGYSTTTNRSLTQDQNFSTLFSGTEYPTAGFIFPPGNGVYVGTSTGRIVRLTGFTGAASATQAAVVSGATGAFQWIKRFTIGAGTGVWLAGTNSGQIWASTASAGSTGWALLTAGSNGVSNGAAATQPAWLDPATGQIRIGTTDGTVQMLSANGTTWTSAAFAPALNGWVAITPTAANALGAQGVAAACTAQTIALTPAGPCWLDERGRSAEADAWLDYGLAVPPGTPFERTGLALSAGDRVIAFSDQPGTGVQIVGFEE